MEEKSWSVLYHAHIESASIMAAVKLVSCTKVYAASNYNYLAYLRIDGRNERLLLLQSLSKSLSSSKLLHL